MTHCPACDPANRSGTHLPGLAPEHTPRCNRERERAGRFDLGGNAQRPDNAAQIIGLRMAAPMRPIAGRTEAIDGLALFDLDRAPALL